MEVTADKKVTTPSTPAAPQNAPIHQPQLPAIGTMLKAAKLDGAAYQAEYKACARRAAVSPTKANCTAATEALYVWSNWYKENAF